MKNSVKALVLLTILNSFSILSFAQLKLPAINGIAPGLKKVLNDYPSQFSNLTGDVISENAQSTDYACNFNFNGAEEAQITRFSANKTMTSFEALMLTTESFEKAKQKFQSLCNQVNNLSISAGAAGNFHLKGSYLVPTESRKFTSVIYSPDPAGIAVKKLKVEVSMEAEQMEWKVKLLVYDKEREDAERGVEKDGE
jgi:hypothetical protein